MTCGPDEKKFSVVLLQPPINQLLCADKVLPLPEVSVYLAKPIYVKSEPITPKFELPVVGPKTYWDDAATNCKVGIPGAVVKVTPLYSVPLFPSPLKSKIVEPLPGYEAETDASQYKTNPLVT